LSEEELAARDAANTTWACAYSPNRGKLCCSFQLLLMEDPINGGSLYKVNEDAFYESFLQHYHQLSSGAGFRSSLLPS
jgi:hypothetical protein